MAEQFSLPVTLNTAKIMFAVHHFLENVSFRLHMIISGMCSYFSPSAHPPPAWIGRIMPAKMSAENVDHCHVAWRGGKHMTGIQRISTCTAESTSSCTNGTIITSWGTGRVFSLMKAITVQRWKIKWLPGISP